MKQAKVLTSAEFKRALAVAKSGRHAERNSIALMLSFYAGLRAKEIAALLVSDIFDSRGKVKSMVTLSASQTKGAKGRVFAVNSKLEAALNGYFGNMSLHNSKRSAPLLRSQKGKELSANSMCSLLIKVYNDAGVEGATSHSGRRSFCTKLCDQGVGIHVIKELAGHKSIQTTARYLATSPTILRNAVELI